MRPLDTVKLCNVEGTNCQKITELQSFTFRLLLYVEHPSAWVSFVGFFWPEGVICCSVVITFDNLYSYGMIKLNILHHSMFVFFINSFLTSFFNFTGQFLILSLSENYCHPQNSLSGIFMNDILSM